MNDKKKHEERKKDFKNSSGISVEPFYCSQDWNAPDHEARDLSVPGQFPFTRGVYPTMYRGRLWTMRQYAGFGSARESNLRYHHLLKQGQTGLSVAFDLPTQMGYDSDHPMAHGEVGRVGVAISSIEDMKILLADLPLNKISTSMTINATAGILLALYIAVARSRGMDSNTLGGTIQNDILKEYIARGTYIYPAKSSMRLITDIFSYCQKEARQWNTISISGYHIREAGSTAVQEVAFTLANGITYVEAALKVGLNIDSFARRLSFFFNVHNHFFEEIAKFRAARRLWAKLLSERYRPKDPQSLMLRFHAQTAGSSLTAQQAENNISRVSLQALAAVLGGTQSLHTNSMDEALGLPTERAATIALRTQQILAFETGVADSIDPLAGSFYLESLTDEIEAKAREYLKRIDALGGVISCIESGWIQKEIQEAAYKTQLAIDNNEEIVVGVNAFTQSVEEYPVETLKISREIETDQCERLYRLKASRDPNRVRHHLTRIKSAASSDINLIPLFVEAVEDKVTLGEISDQLRKVFGSYRECI